MGNPQFEVRVAGVVPEEDLLDLGVVAKTTELPQTVLYGEIRDESTLLGLLNRLRGLGIEIVEVRQVPDFSTVEGTPPPEERRDNGAGGAGSDEPQL